MGVFQTILGEIFKHALELAGVALETAFEEGGKIFQFFCWMLAGVVIVPCLFVSGTLYPMWEKWGENIKR